MKPDSPRRPAYTPLDPNSIRNRIHYLRTYQPPIPVGGSGGGYNYNPYPYGYGYGYGFGMFYIGSGFFCDPFGFWTCYSPFGYYPGGSFYLFPNMAFLAPFGMYPCPFAYSPYSPGSLLYYSPFSSFYFGGYFPPCAPTPYDPLSFGLAGNNSSLTPLQSSVLISNGVIPGLQSASSMAAAVSGNASEAASESVVPGATANLGQAAASSSAPIVYASGVLSPGEPLTLVFTNGATVLATEYRLTSDGKLRYVTVDGASFTVPLDQLDLAKTVAANSQKGVQFLLPPSPQTQPPSRPR